jgi:hypothetical protein
MLHRAWRVRWWIKAVKLTIFSAKPSMVPEKTFQGYLIYSDGMLHREVPYALCTLFLPVLL